jgi:hypothetical protein
MVAPAELPDNPAHQRGDGRLPQRLLPFAAILLGLVVFLPMLWHTFYRDDFGWVERAIDALPHPAQWFFLAKSDFRPLSSLSFVLNLAIGGLDPRGYYALNLLFHLANVALLMALVRRISGGSTLAAGIAGLIAACAFGNYGEAVHWISGRTEPIADVFVLGALIAHWDWLARGRGRDRVIAVLCFALALLGKESAVILLPLLWLLEWAHPARPGAHGAITRHAPYAVLLAAYLVFEFGYWRAGSTIQGSEYAFGWHAVTNLFEYLVRMWLPVSPTSMLVSLPAAALPALRVAYVVLAVAIPLAGLFLLSRPIPRAQKFALLWIPIALLPVIWFTFRTNTRYLYLPSLGLAAFLGMAAAEVLERSPVRSRRIAVSVALKIALIVQVGVLQVILLRRATVERAEGPARWAELREHAARR